MMLLLSWNLWMTLLTNFHFFYFFYVYICIIIVLFHFTIILLFFHFGIEIVCIETLIIWEVYLILIRLTCLRISLVDNQINFFIIFSDLAEYNGLAHDLINLIERIIALIIHFILHNVAMAILVRYLHFLFLRWSHFFLLISFLFQFWHSNIRSYFRCVTNNFLCLFHFYYFFIFILYVYLCQLIVSNCRLVLWEDVLFEILK